MDVKATLIMSQDKIRNNKEKAILAINYQGNWLNCVQVLVCLEGKTYEQ